jgi:glycosyltransferase involved in cell wall biosynthesis
MVIWFDVEDLFDYARVSARPSGIQRLSFELYAALQDLDPVAVRFVRTDPRRATMCVVGWNEVAAVFRRMADAPAREAPHRLPDAPPILMRSRLARLPGARTVAQRLPGELRMPLGAAMRGQVVVLRNLARALRAVPSAITASRQTGAPLAVSAHGEDLREAARPGDVLASFGSPWGLPDHAQLVARMRAAAGLRYAFLVYDVIPLVRPEFCDANLVRMFSELLRGCLPQADIVLAISESAARDTAAWCARQGIALPAPPRAIPIGTGFSHAQPAETLPEGLTPGGYALFVSTIEARKNHLLAFRAWRCLLDELPREQVPTLVFAGRVGWLVADLLQQIENTGHLGGKLVIIENPDDQTLAALYRDARFTIFPSLYEGWGLPVSESLSFGKVCLASNAASVPEAGGAFCLYHDPDNVTEATALYRRAITEPGLIPALEQRIREEYRPTPWSASARAVLDALG